MKSDLIHAYLLSAVGVFALGGEGVLAQEPVEWCQTHVKSIPGTPYLFIAVALGMW